MRFSLACAGALALCLCTTGAQAHHSFAMFNQQKEVTVTGKVKAFQWTNPHCYIQIIAADANGKNVEWSMEMGAPMYLYARGWRPSTVKPGDEIILKINPLRNGRPGGVVLDAKAADGRQLGKKAL